MKIKLFTYDDFDGIGCAILSKMAYGNNVDIEYCNYNNINKKIKNFILNKEYFSYEKILLVGVLINKKVSQLINNIIESSHNRKLFQLLTHHEITHWLNEYQWVKVQSTTINKENESITKTTATSLLFQYLVDNNVINI